MASRLCLLLLLCLLHTSWTQAKSVQEKEKDVLEKILSGYDVRIRPTGVNSTNGSAPTVVTVNMFVRSIDNIDDKNMEFDVQVTFRQSWLDQRLKYEANDLKYVTLNDRSALWVPDLFFSNEKEAKTHDLTTPNMYFRVAPSGEVMYSQRISLSLSCPMNFKRFPFDRQTCSMRMASYGYTTDDLVFLWKEADPVQIVRNLQVPKFTLDQFNTDYCNSKTLTGEYSCLRVDLLFCREINYYLVSLFIPSVMLCMLSWVVFWLDRAAITARCLIGMTTILGMAVHSCSFNATIAIVSYTRSSDVWSGICLTFMFVALMETATVHYWSRREERQGCGATAAACVETPATDEEAMDMKPLVEQPEEVIPKEENGSPSKFRLKERASGLKQRLSKISRCSKRLDIISRVFFPLVFVIFVVIFVIVNYVH